MAVLARHIPYHSVHATPSTLHLKPSAISRRCFSVMGSLLHFNICDLESSLVCNDEVPGLAGLIKEHIPPHLEYVSLHWAQHLTNVPGNSGIHDMLSDFAHHGLLSWFEVLSLVKAFNRLASHALLDAAVWCEVSY